MAQRNSVGIAFLCSFYLFNLCAYAGGDTMNIEISSTAFQHEGKIPSQYTCDGKDVSPPLTWEKGPVGTQSYVLISDDPDAPIGTWVHWVLYNIPPEISELPENVPAVEILDNGAIHGVTDFGRIGYGGPCPPSGTHRYFFKIYALDTVLSLSSRSSKRDVEGAMQGHILAEGKFMGNYKRR